MVLLRPTGGSPPTTGRDIAALSMVERQLEKEWDENANPLRPYWMLDKQHLSSLRGLEGEAMSVDRVSVWNFQDTYGSNLQSCDTCRIDDGKFESVSVKNSRLKVILRMYSALD